MSRTTQIALALSLLAALGLGACGRKGKLEPPPEQNAARDSQGNPKDPGVEKPHRRMPMDFLLN